MRRRSFYLTTEQIRRREKFVTRRFGWKNAKPGTQILAVSQLRVKNPEFLAVIEDIDVRRERLWEIYATGWEDDGVTPILRPLAEQYAETALEGFPDLDGQQFVAMLCKSTGLDDDDIDVTRIEFRYLGMPCDVCGDLDSNHHVRFDGCLCKKQHHLFNWRGETPDRCGQQTSEMPVGQHTLRRFCAVAECDHFTITDHGFSRLSFKERV